MSMKLEVENGELVFRDVFSGVMFVTDEGQMLSVCMRDGGFEIGLFPENGKYGPKWVSIQEGKILDDESNTQE